MAWQLRLAEEADVGPLASLIATSVHGLQSKHYTEAQRVAALGPVFGVDRQLIRDGTYFVVPWEGQLIGGGGWSRRRSHYGGDAGRVEPDDLLVPGKDAARIRAFFVHPAWARRGIGRALMEACEDAIRRAGFTRVEMVATLTGEPLYVAFGYRVAERYEISLAAGLTLPVVRMTKETSL